MKLATFTHHSQSGIGVVAHDQMLPLARADVPSNMLQFLHLGEAAMVLGEAAMVKARQVLQAGGSGLPLEEVQLQPPGYLQVGDVVRIEIEKLGVLENWVEKEPGGTVIE